MDSVIGMLEKACKITQAVTDGRLLTAWELFLPIQKFIAERLMDPTIKPEWRTPDVTAICLGMRETQDFSALPILADALQDANCDNEALLEHLRNGSQGFAADTKLVALMVVPEAKESLAFVRKFLDAINGEAWEEQQKPVVTYERLMEQAGKQLSGSRWDGWITLPFNTPDFLYEDSSMMKEFWHHFAIITGRPVPDEHGANFFCCSC